MHIRIIYEELGKEKGYTTITNRKDMLLERLERLNIGIQDIKVLKIDGKEYNPQKLHGR